MNGPLLSYTIAREFHSGISDGSLNLIGAVIKEQATGKIVAQVQPTKLLQSAIDLANPVGLA